MLRFILKFHLGLCCAFTINFSAVLIGADESQSALSRKFSSPFVGRNTYTAATPPLDLSVETLEGVAKRAQERLERALRTKDEADILTSGQYEEVAKKLDSLERAMHESLKPLRVLSLSQLTTLKEMGRERLRKLQQSLLDGVPDSELQDYLEAVEKTTESVEIAEKKLADILGYVLEQLEYLDQMVDLLNIIDPDKETSTYKILMNLKRFQKSGSESEPESWKSYLPQIKEAKVDLSISAEREVAYLKMFKRFMYFLEGKADLHEQQRILHRLLNDAAGVDVEVKHISLLYKRLGKNELFSAPLAGVGEKRVLYRQAFYKNLMTKLIALYQDGRIDENPCELIYQAKVFSVASDLAAFFEYVTIALHESIRTPQRSGTLFSLYPARIGRTLDLIAAPESGEEATEEE